MNEGIIAAIATGGAGLLVALSTLVVNIIKAKKLESKDLSNQNTHEETLLRIGQGSFNTSLEIQKQLSDLNENVKSYKIEQNFFNQMYLRHSILCTYEQFRVEKRIPENWYQSVLGLFDVYQSCGGNSFAKDLVEEIKEWERY